MVCLLSHIASVLILMLATVLSSSSEIGHSCGHWLVTRWDFSWSAVDEMGARYAPVSNSCVSQLAARLVLLN
jgi:hypothetical protein